MTSPKGRNLIAGVMPLIIAGGTPGCGQVDRSPTKAANDSSFAGSASAPIAAVADARGNIHVPSDYRSSYRFAGTWAVAADKGAGSQQLHSVYISPGGIEAHKNTGHFPDGTVLVKEVFAAETKPMTTGTVSHSGKLIGWFVMVKDSKNTHPGNKLWGDGWGWAWFDSDKPNATKSTDYQTDCKGCHEPARAKDWTYVEGYPELRSEAR